MQEMRTKEEAFKHGDGTHRSSKMVKVCEWNLVTKDVEVTTYDCVPVVAKQKRICETWRPGHRDQDNHASAAVPCGSGATAAAATARSITSGRTTRGPMP